MRMLVGHFAGSLNLKVTRTESPAWTVIGSMDTPSLCARQSLPKSDARKNNTPKSGFVDRIAHFSFTLGTVEQEKLDREWEYFETVCDQVFFILVSGTTLLNVDQDQVP